MKVIEITKGRAVIVDDEDFSELAQYRWCSDMKGYVHRGRRAGEDWPTGLVIMHRWLMGNPKGMQVDHINGNKLDNRRCNLRVCTNAENGRNQKIRKKNTVGLKGVTMKPRALPYAAQICHNRKKIWLGQYATAEEAHAAYCEAAIRLHGEFARLN